MRVPRPSSARAGRAAGNPSSRRLPHIAPSAHPQNHFGCPIHALLRMGGKSLAPPPTHRLKNRGRNQAATPSHKTWLSCLLARLAVRVLAVAMRRLRRYNRLLRVCVGRFVVACIVQCRRRRVVVSCFRVVFRCFQMSFFRHGRVLSLGSLTPDQHHRTPTLRPHAQTGKFTEN